MEQFKVGDVVPVNTMLKITGTQQTRAGVIYATNHAHIFETDLESIRIYGSGCISNPYKPKQDKQPEPIKLYCVNDNNGICTKGNVYTIKSGSIQWDEFYEGNNYISFDDYKKRSPITASCLVPLVSRPAKVGEWVYITHTDFETIKVGDIAKVTAAPHSAGCIGVVSKSGNGSSHGHWHYNESEYLVLDGYQPFTR